MRKACLQSIYELALRDPRIVFVGSDLGAGTLEEFRREMPKRFFMEGISEAYVVGMAAGLARDGLIPYVNTIATFITRRALEQVAVDLCLQNLPVRLIGNGGGLVYAPLGPTHLATEDLALMRALPNMTVIAPTDAEEMRRCMAVTPDWPGPLYIRLAKGYDPVVSRPQDDFVIGRSILLRPPGEVLIVACGVMVQRALGAADLLRQRGIAAGVLNMHTLKPLDQETLRHWAPRVRALVTLEEHNRIGGLGSAVAECLVDAGVAPPLLRLGLPDAFPEHYGSQDSLLEHYGLQPAHIAHRIADCFPPPEKTPHEPPLQQPQVPCLPPTPGGDPRASDVGTGTHPGQAHQPLQPRLLVLRLPRGRSAARRRYGPA
jgi:transketolase